MGELERAEPRPRGVMRNDCSECSPIWCGAGHCGWHMSCHGCGMDMVSRWSGWVGDEVFVTQYDIVGDHHPACRGGGSELPHGQIPDDQDIYTFDGYQTPGEQWQPDIQGAVPAPELGTPSPVPPGGERG